MSLASYIQAMPKVDLHVHLEGAVQKKTLQMLADQNEISDNLKHYKEWVGLIDKPDYKRLHDIIRIIGGWMLEPENLSRLVYDVGTTLAKQNVRYAEVSVNPATYTQLNLSADDFLTAINDGRERAQRAWGIEMAWIFIVPRDEPRRADELARWITSVNARRGGVLALGLSGRESVQPVGQFERPFRSIEKKGIPRVVRAGDQQGLEGVQGAIEVLAANRLFDAWGIAQSPDILKHIVENHIGVGVNLTRAVKNGFVEKAADFPLRQLYDADVPVFLGSDMPTLYHATLNDQYQIAAEQCGFAIDELETLALNAVRSSFMADEAKAEMEERFKSEYASLRESHEVAV